MPFCPCLSASLSVVNLVWFAEVRQYIYIYLQLLPTCIVYTYKLYCRAVTAAVGKTFVLMIYYYYYVMRIAVYLYICIGKDVQRPKIVCHPRPIYYNIYTYLYLLP